MRCLGVSVLRTGTPRRTFSLPSMSYNPSMPDTHHLAKPELRKRIREMLSSGMSQAAIARQLHKSVSTVAFHVRNLGIKPKEYTTPEPIIRGRRRCAECGRSKTIGAFPTPRVAVCTVCRRSRKKQPD
jgi:helix-turn-helix protein